MAIYYIFCLILLSFTGQDVITDSDLTFEEAIKGTNAPQVIIDELVLTDVYYYSFDNKLHKGQLVIHKTLEKDIKEIFFLLRENKFPVKKVLPIVMYDWSDNESMKDNNTSAFNYRFIAGTKRLSNHSYGRAIDINPFQNPAVYKNGKISPPGAVYNKSKAGTIVDDDFIVRAFLDRGWRWGGHWNSLKDYQHFDKNS